MATPAHRILIVEDHQELRKLVASFLDSQGYEVVEAANGTDGIRAALTEQPKFILLDLRLPDIDGVEVARTLRRSLHTAHIPIVGWTIDCFSELYRKALVSAGFTDCLTKPSSLSAISAVVEQHGAKPQR
jgi:CheY-like chemotaxis protein